jgi:hypothetical protein
MIIGYSQLAPPSWRNSQWPEWERECSSGVLRNKKSPVPIPNIVQIVPDITRPSTTTAVIASAPKRATRVRRSVRILAAIALGTLVNSLGAPPKERLLAERRDAHARELKSCGRKKACIMKPNAAVHDGNSILADLGPSTAQVRTRWTKNEYDSVTVWIAPGDEIPQWRVANRYMVRDAFHAWTAAGAPVRFIFVPDSMRADVKVLWRDSLPDGRAGQVTRFTDARGWLRGAIIEMNTRNMAGGVQDSSTVRAVAMHEVGHLLGLEHSGNERDIMSAWVTARSLTARDRSAMRALYGVSAALGD